MCALSFSFVSTSLNLLAWIEKCLNNKLRIKSRTCEYETQVNSTVNLEIFVEVYSHESSPIRSFARINPEKWQNSFSFTMEVNHAKVTNFNVANMSVFDIRQNKILAKTFEFTVAICIWMGIIARKPVFWVSNKVRFKPVCSATENS